MFGLVQLVKHRNAILFIAVVQVTNTSKYHAREVILSQRIALRQPI
jgi:hypothetical protein